MKELIKVNEKGLVSARELYLGLGMNKSQWSRWYRMNIINDETFKENIDWETFNMQLNGNETKNFNISLDMATHIINSAKTVSSKTKLKILDKLGLSNKVDLISRKEIEFIDLLENVLEPFGYKCIRQYAIGKKYKIDLYIVDLNIVIEYDENNHKDYTYEQQEGRQKEIEKELKCKFIRVSDCESNAYNVGLVIKGIYEN